ncbi:MULTISPECIES: hypothetical protein [unclassified Sphingobacterium]|uniref:hypothetical protein n=1 Tax=unclassified Sphingobacterium TaxID=2609468 RepID=UPI0025D8CFC9|nr:MULTISPECIES: hypothetical protein [unclassified Sphingobacterium]
MKYSFLILILAASSLVKAQEFEQIKQPKEPLVLQSIGSFYVGGESVMQTKSDLGDFAPEGHVTKNQMYVQFMKPQRKVSNKAFVLIHGMTLTGKTYETTPDGRMGWNEYFVRKGYDTYVVDQFGVGRSGFNSKLNNQVRSGEISADRLPALIRISDENAHLNFRIGPKNKQRFNNARLSEIAFSEFSKQGVPFRSLVSREDYTIAYGNIAKLSSEIKNTILVSHSQSGPFPLHAALMDSSNIKGAVIIEPAPADFGEEDVEKLANIPFIVIFGDNLNNDTGMSHRWSQMYDSWKNFVDKVNKAGGKASIVRLPDLGIYGNGHMLMQESNNLQIADYILNWSAKL